MFQAPKRPSLPSHKPGSSPGYTGADFAGTPLRGAAHHSAAAAAAASTSSSTRAAARAAQKKGVDRQVRLSRDRPASQQELLRRLHARAQAQRPLLRGRRESISAPQSGSQQIERLDADENHPLYGRYIAEWLAENEAEPGRVLLSFLRSRLGEMRAAISRGKDKFDGRRGLGQKFGPGAPL